MLDCLGRARKMAQHQMPLQCPPFCPIPGLLWAQTCECPRPVFPPSEKGSFAISCRSLDTSYCCPTEVLTLLRLPCVKLPMERATPAPENNRNMGPSRTICGHVGTVREPLTGHLVGPDIHSSSWGQAGARAKWAQGAKQLPVWPGSALCPLHSLGSVLRAFRGSAVGSL